MDTRFRFKGELKDRMQSYGDYVAATSEMLEHITNVNPLLFACESAFISGEDPDRIPWPGRYTKVEEAELPWISEFKINDVMLAESCLNSKGRRGHINDPVMINMPICRNRRTAKWRASTYLGTRTGFPSAIYSKQLVRRWQRIVIIGAERLHDAPIIKRRVFSWTMHDAFICIQPFKDGNERTARLLLQLIRRELDLPPIFISRSDMRLHKERIRLFRQEIFVPLMLKYNYISDL